MFDSSLKSCFLCVLEIFLHVLDPDYLRSVLLLWYLWSCSFFKLLGSFYSWCSEISGWFQISWRQGYIGTCYVSYSVSPFSLNIHFISEFLSLGILFLYISTISSSITLRMQKKMVYKLSSLEYDTSFEQIYFSYWLLWIYFLLELFLRCLAFLILLYMSKRSPNNAYFPMLWSGGTDLICWPECHFRTVVQSTEYFTWGPSDVNMWHFSPGLPSLWARNCWSPTSSLSTGCIRSKEEVWGSI